MRQQQPLDLAGKFQGLNISKLRVLDVGCGTYNSPLSSQMKSLPFAKLYSVDGAAPEIKRLEAIKPGEFAAAYHWLGVRYAQNLETYHEHEVDVVMFLDVIEHLPKEVAIQVIKEAMEAAEKRVLIWLPLNKAPQGALGGNELQVHLSEWTPADLEALGFEVHVYEAFHRHFDPPVDAAWAIYDRKKAEKEVEKKVERILIDRLDVHGDVLVATSVLPGLQEKYPDAVIDWHVRSGYDFALKNNPRIREIIPGPVGNLEALHRKYDLVITPEHHMNWHAPMAVVHCECAKVKFHAPELWLTEAELNIADHLKNRILVATHAGWYSRQCFNLTPVLTTLRQTHPDLLQVDLGVGIPNVEYFKGTLRQVAALMKYARLYIGIDTVFMHMAVALGIPMALVLGPTGPETQYIPKAVFIRPFVNLNPAEPREEFRNGIQLTEEEILSTIRQVLLPDGTVIAPEIEYNY